MNTGRLTNDEKDFIKKNYVSLSYKEIATALDRRVEPIRKYIQNTLGQNLVGDSDKESKAEYDLKRKAYWRELESQFSFDELNMFVFHWKRIIAQFNDEVFPTEELQIIDAIKLEILMNRLLTEQQQTILTVESFRAELKKEKEKELVDQDVVKIQSLYDQIANIITAQESIQNNYKAILQEKNKILKDLKATRDQRIKRVEEMSTSFAKWLAEILNNTELRKNLGLNMEKMRLAAEEEKKRLSEIHIYEDQTADLPFLNHETVDNGK